MFRFKIIGVGSDDEGMCATELEEACRQGSVKAVFVIPSMQNPMVITMSERRRNEIAEISERCPKRGPHGCDRKRRAEATAGCRHSGENLDGVSPIDARFPACNRQLSEIAARHLCLWPWASGPYARPRYRSSRRSWFRADVPMSTCNNFGRIGSVGGVRSNKVDDSGRWCMDRDVSGSVSMMGLSMWSVHCGRRNSGGACKHTIEDCAADGGLDQRAFGVTIGGLPFHPAVSTDCRNMLVPLAGRSTIDCFDRVGAWRNDDGYSSVVIDDHVVGGLPVIGAIGCELPDRTANLVEQWFNLRDITSVLIRQRMGNDLTAVGIQWRKTLA